MTGGGYNHSLKFMISGWAALVVEHAAAEKIHYCIKDVD